MGNDSVAYSRAGDVFHYRWAARRCLKLIYPNSSLEKIFIEGSDEAEKAGELVIDVSEYSTNPKGKQVIDYYQLKHTTVKVDEPFTLSDLKDTIEGFSKRYILHRDAPNPKIAKVAFTIITNRKIAASFKDNLSAILNGQTVDSGFLKTITKYTKLSSQNLASFCRLLNLQDGEGNYNVQKDELRLEMARLVAGSIDNAELNNLVSLVQEKVMPYSDSSISREEVLKRFGVTSERDLYPAPAIWEVSEKIIERTQHSLLQDKIVESQYPVIIHAAGGVGKSVFCRQLINSLPENHLGIAYDCFGAGSYRNRSETRHGHRVALVQIANELASKGLCNPLLVRDTTLDEDIMRQFLSRIDASVKSLKEVDSSAMLFILVDAADNAEMAAKEYTQSCFAHELLREKIPQDCKLVLLCRTERIDHLQPESYVLQIELEGFSKEETLTHLQRSFRKASEDDGIEFHRLTSGNPRVQSNALDAKHTKIVDLLSSLGPSGITVQEQIALQLSSAISKIKDQLPKVHHEQINSICTGLASLPPHIPIEVLSAVTGVSIEHIKSFVSDIGRSLWLSDNTVQFRDEPTETWFRETFVPTEKSCGDYIKLLEPIASQRSYIAEVLPQLYLQAGQYEKLIQIALSDDYLPDDNPIDARNIRVYRLQFAFKAALRLSKFNDAIRLAMRAGEESAGNERQLGLFLNNTDLIPVLQSKEKVQEIAFKRLLGSGWDGSENIYAASLLSGIKDYHGEARGYLRAALNWLVMYYNDNTTTKRRRRGNDDVSMNDVLNLARAHLNILGVKDCANFLKRFTSKRWIFPIVQTLTRRLIDIEDFKTIDDFLKACKNEVYFIVAVTSELLKVARFPNASILTSGLQLLCSSKKRIEIPSDDFQDPIVPGIISFLEACIYRELDDKKILSVINYYTPEKAYRMVYESHFPEQRTKFLKALAIRVLLNGEQTFDIEKISPAEFQVKKKNYEHNDEFQKLKEFVSCLFPWYFLRVQILFDKNLSLFGVIDDTDSRSSKAMSYRYSYNNTLPDELAQIRASIIIFYSNATKEEVDQFFARFVLKDKNFRIHNKIETLRSSYRLQHLKGICQKLENHVYELIQSYRDDSPDELSDKYIALTRAVLTNSTEDASIYFDDAINIVSKFGDEIVERWRAIVSIAEKSCGCSETSDELTYRFIRCAELVGENVDREKYWDRGKATQICIRMSAGVGISALSRWRDRDIGRYKYQFADALNELVKSKLISPSVGWSLTLFCDLSHIEFLSLCIENESSTEIQHQILQDAVYLTQLEGSSAGYWDQLKSIAAQHNLKNPTLDSIVELQQIDENEDEKPDVAFSSEASNENWDVIFEGIEITTVDGFTRLLDRFKIGKQEDDFEWRLRYLLDEAVTRINLRNIWSFIEILFLFDDFSRYNIANIISSLPESFKKKVSFKSNLEMIVHRFGERFAHELMGDSLQYFVEYLNLDEKLTTKLKSGMLQGLAAGEEFAQSNVFFGFVELAVTEIDRNNAVDLLDFSLGRFELHIDTKFGDEEWSDKLIVTDDVDINIAGYLWSAIGSPRSEVRWNTAHCVRKLVEFNCCSTIDALMGWLKFGGVGAFGASKFPFYDLHAKQYLLMALHSASSTNPDMLRKHHDLFIDFALSTKHILIQKFAAGIILNIENKFQGTYSKADLERVKEIGVSQFPIEKKDYNYSTNSYWHDANMIDLTLDTKVGFDMGDYWYKPLGEVFGVSQKQIEQLAAEVVVNEWKMNRESGYNNDPRVSIWNNSQGDRETYYYKASYPSTDNLDFYIEYHAMLSVAAKLLEKMPTINTSDWRDEPWDYWLSRHMLLYENGIWLADCRDPLPMNRPSWIKVEKKDKWKVELKTEDFLQYLITNEKENTWISIRGASHEKQDERKEIFYVRTALVSKNTSDALLRALSTCSDPMDYKLPHIDEDRAEIDSGIFQLKGWNSEASVTKGIEERDPLAFGIEPSSFIIDENILNRFNLISDDANKIWMEKDSQKKVLISKTWSSSWKGKDEEVDQSGVILTADLSFLKNLCDALDCELIFDLSLKRDTYHRYSKEEKEYAKPQHKIFILSADGKLRSSDENYQLG
jgi:DNA-binding Xre family transcriptional regulator